MTRCLKSEKLTKNIYVTLNTRFLTYIVLNLIIAVLSVSCDEIQSVVKDFVPDKKVMTLNVTSMKTSDGYKTLKFDIFDNNDIPYDLSDSVNVRAEITETYDRVLGIDGFSQPKLVRVNNECRRTLDSLNLGFLIVVDATTSQANLDSMCNYMDAMRNLFGEDHVFVSFMSGKEVGENLQLTPYVIQNYFKTADTDVKLINKTIIDKVTEMNNPADNSPFKKFDNLALFVVSDGVLYDSDDYPYDPDHFANSQRVLSLASVIKGNFRFYYHSLPDPYENEAGEVDDIISLAAKRYGGHFFSDHNYSINRVIGCILDDFKCSHVGYSVVVSNPAGKTYLGSMTTMNMQFYQGTKLVAQGSYDYVIGSFANPVVVEDTEGERSAVLGVLGGLFVILVVFLIMQLLVPYVQYRIFRRKNVFNYLGPNMTVNGHVIGETCYLCKGKFEPGDLIVAKCQHTMHEECWNENGYKCPEHGPRCPDGSHYYNRKQLMDPLNGFYYTWWIIFALVGTILAWLLSIRYFHELTALFVSSALCWLTRANERPLRRLAHSLLYGGVALLMTVVTFGAYWMLSQKIGFGDAIYVGWLPRTVMFIVMLYCATSLNHRAFNNITLIAAISVAVFELILWTLLSMDTSWNSQAARLIAMSVISVSVAVLAVRVHPKSSRYFLHVEGPVKTMDIAIYKLFSSYGETREVTIGRSVDCTLQLSWDIQSDIASVQARITRRRGYMVLQVVEGVVMRGKKPMTRGKSFDLYNGLKFSIGKTEFTYIEKDIRIK